MLRSFIGKILEWFLNYNHLVVVSRTDFVARLPKGQYSDDAGYDLYVSNDTTIPAGAVGEVPSGIILDPRTKIWFEIKARSSTFRKRGLEVQDAVIDRGYRGEMFAIVYNPSDKPIEVKKGERICQIVPHRLIPCKFTFGDLSQSDRGIEGFGSSGQ